MASLTTVAVVSTYPLSLPAHLDLGSMTSNLMWTVLYIIYVIL